jgi:hypothetical protein
MAIKATQFRAQLFRVLAAVLEDGQAIEIELSGQILELRPKPPAGNKLARLVQRAVTTNPEDDLLSAGWDMAAWERKWDERGGTTLPILGARKPKSARKRAGGARG